MGSFPEFPRALRRCHTVPTRNHSNPGSPSHWMTSSSAVSDHRARWLFFIRPSSSSLPAIQRTSSRSDTDPLSTITTDPIANIPTYVRAEAVGLLESVTRTRNLIHNVSVGVWVLEWRPCRGASFTSYTYQHHVFCLLSESLSDNFSVCCLRSF